MKLFDEINLSGLTPKERTTAQQIFMEEADVFLEDWKQNINLNRH